MKCNLKNLFLHYLKQLHIITEKIPAELFTESLALGMFPLATNARIAANFALRGYCPLLKQEIVSYFEETKDKDSVLVQISKTIEHLQKLPEIDELSEHNSIKEKAGFTEVELPEPQFIHQYILPNFYFHISMVYAVAKANGVELSKGDFDGLHSYPENFSFLNSGDTNNE